MPAVVTTVLLDQLWTLIEGGANTPALVLAGNRINRSAVTWRMRDRSRKAANDFPKLEIEVGVSGSHSGFAKDETLATERTDFLDGTDPFDIERTEEVYIRVTENKPSDDAANAIREAIVDDVMRGGPRLGLPSLVLRIGKEGEKDVFKFRRRDTRKDETDVRGNVIPWPGTITEIRFFVVCLEDGRASLAP